MESAAQRGLRSTFFTCMDESQILLRHLHLLLQKLKVTYICKRKERRMATWLPGLQAASLQTLSRSKQHHHRFCQTTCHLSNWQRKRTCMAKTWPQLDAVEQGPTAQRLFYTQDELSLPPVQQSRTPRI